ncbi:MAG: hypothetical protein E7580_08195 [Ruminococcaceae bacterium]|nr:hypothetical protein [Oscillospiraceae bacterium]
MASVYKLKRKNDKKPEQADLKKTDEALSELLVEQEPAIPEKAPETKEKASHKEDESLFSPAESTSSLPKDYAEVLAVPKVDTEKLDAVFSHTKGTVGSDSSAEEYDETADLLREIFGTEHGPKRKKKKVAVEPVKIEEDVTVFPEAAEEAEYVADHASEEEKTRDYIAVHDGEEEKTKEYSSLSELTEADVDPAEMTRTDIPPLTNEFHVSDEIGSDDPYNDTYEELETKYERKSILPDEFTSIEEYDEFAEHLRNKNFRSLSSILWTFLAFLAVFYLESATFLQAIPHPDFLKPGGMYNDIYLLLDLQILFISALVVSPSLIRGFKNLFSGKPDRNSVLSLLYLLSTAFVVVLLIRKATVYPLFGCVATLFAFLNSIANFLDAKRVYRTFRIFGSRHEKLVAKLLEGDTPEAETFRDQLDGEPRFYSIQKANFIDTFFARLDERSKADRSFGWIMVLSLLLSIGFAVLTYLREPGVINTATSFMTMAVMTLPLSCAFSISLPFAHISAKSEKIGSAIISVAAAESHAAADVVSFTDKEIFPPKSVKITTIRTYGQTRIDKAILYSAMIFQKLGGPLSEVFKKTISGVVEEISEDFDFKEITADGMCASIEGHDIFVGNKNYLLSYDFGYTKDDQDEEFEARHGKIMYMVIDSELAAKFYIRYSISKQFKKTVLTLFRSGICPAVKTCDPNVDSDLFRTLLQNNKIPAGIIKSCEAMKDAPVAEKSESGIVCVSSIAKLLRTFSHCDSLRHLTRANVAMKILSIVLGAGIVVFLSYLGILTKITGMIAMIYHLLWLIPIVIPSLTE